MTIYSGSSAVKCIEKTSAKWKCLEKTVIRILSIFNEVICALQKSWILLEIINDNIWTIQMSFSRSIPATANIFFLIKSTCLVAEKALTAVYNLYLNSQLLKLILILLQIKKNIQKIISILMSANRNVSLKNWDF